jgi:hypothetical protein
MSCSFPYPTVMMVSRLMIQGNLNTYRFCDNVWTFVLNKVEFRDGGDVVNVDKVKIVACDGKGWLNLLAFTFTDNFSYSYRFICLLIPCWWNKRGIVCDPSVSESKGAVLKLYCMIYSVLTHKPLVVLKNYPFVMKT